MNTPFATNSFALPLPSFSLVALLGAGGKPSTWLPPGKLVEHNQHPCGAVSNDDCAPTGYNKATNNLPNQGGPRTMICHHPMTRAVQNMRHVQHIQHCNLPEVCRIQDEHASSRKNVRHSIKQMTFSNKTKAIFLEVNQTTTCTL